MDYGSIATLEQSGSKVEKIGKEEMLKIRGQFPCSKSKIRRTALYQTVLVAMHLNSFNYNLIMKIAEETQTDLFCLI